MGSSEVVVVCEDAGAAAALAVVAAALGEHQQLRLVVAGPAAVPAFHSNGLDVASELGAALLDGNPTLVTGSTMWGERIEARAVREARARGHRSVTFVDFWGNYRERLSFPSDDQLEVLPTKLAVVDETMRDDVVAIGVPASVVVVTGSPALDQVASRGSLPTDPTGPVVFLSQPIDALYGTRLGYTERTVLSALAPHVQAMSRELHVRPHPREDVAGLRAFVASLPGTCRLREEGDLEGVLCSASVVSGMTTIALVEAALRGLPTLSLQFGAIAPQLLPTTRSGVTRVVCDEALLDQALTSVRPPPSATVGPGHAVQRILALLEEE
jgi:hypothetical protein